MPYRVTNAKRHPDTLNAHAFSEDLSHGNRVDTDARNKTPDTKAL